MRPHMKLVILAYVVVFGICGYYALRYFQPHFIPQSYFVDYDKPVYTKGQYGVCRTAYEFDQLVEIILQNDTDAAWQFAYRHQCRVLKPGTQVFVMDSKWSGKVKVRPKGEPTYFWTFKDELRN